MSKWRLICSSSMKLPQAGHSTSTGSLSVRIFAVVLALNEVCSDDDMDMLCSVIFSEHVSCLLIVVSSFVITHSPSDSLSELSRSLINFILAALLLLLVSFVGGVFLPKSSASVG